MTIETELKHKFRTSDPSMNARCCECGLIYGKHIGHVCPKDFTEEVKSSCCPVKESKKMNTSAAPADQLRDLNIILKKRSLGEKDVTVTFKKGNITGGTIVRMRGGRSQQVIRDKSKYTRKRKHKNGEN